MECIKVENLSFTYPGANKKALDNISFTVSEGEFITVCGLSGSGKSTLLRQLKPVSAPYGEKTGNIYFKNKSVDELGIREQASEIGFVMQSPDNQSITDKVWHELAFGLENLGLSSYEIQKRTAETASFFGIEGWFEKSVDKLSGGERQILNLASVMVMQPAVLILDEPISQLSPVAAEEFIFMLKRINTELGTTVIVSEHELEGFLSVSSSVIVMSEGTIIAQDSPESIGKILYDKRDAVFMSLPSYVRIYEYLESGINTPVSVLKGREWLKQYSAEHIPRKPAPHKMPVHNGKPIIELKDIWFRYEKNSEDILKGLNLNIYSGEHLALLGGNGAGKTTMLSVLCGILRQYRGTVRINGKPSRKNIHKNKIAFLPQNPQALFVRSSVEDELSEMLEGTDISDEDRIRRIKYAAELCELENLMKQHPYDLSGGEQQKTALAKLLLTEPKILLLDEPTKGLDSSYKLKLSKIISKLTANGTSVVTVSHDIEFCAAHSDRCAMLFNGRIICDDSPKKFFSDNVIYTTSVCRMSHGILENAVTADDIIYAFSAEIDDHSFISRLPESRTKSSSKSKNDNINIISTNKSSKKGIDIFLAVSMFFIFLTSLFNTAGLINIHFIRQNTILSYLVLFASVFVFIICIGRGSKKLYIVKNKRTVKRTMISIFMVFIAVPLTVSAGVYFLDDSKYLFISLLVMLESIVPFFIMFEKRNIHAGELVLIASLCAMCVAGRAVFYMLPEFKPVTALVIISAAALGSESGFMIGSVSMLVSNIFFGQGIWTPWQMLAMGIIGFLAGAVFQRKIFTPNKVTIALFGFTSAYVIYGGIMNPATLILSRSTITFESLLSVFTLGLPVDTVHAISTAVFLYIGSESIISKLERIKLKYGLVSAK